MTTSRLLHEQMKGKRPAKMLDHPNSKRRPPAVVRVTERDEQTGERTGNRPHSPHKAGGGYKPKPIVSERRRMVTRCIGVPRVGRYKAERCEKLVRYTVRQGRPSPRCGDCRVVKAWRAMFTYEEPVAVAEAIVRLARSGRIGRAFKKS